MNRSDLQRLSQLRLKEARVLLRNSCYSGSYYLCGYVIECALKACIAKKIRRGQFPDLEVVKKSYVHDLETLIKTAELERDLDAQISTSQSFGINWNVVKDWRSESRYEFHSERESQDLYKAVSSRRDGILRWIKRYW